MFYKIMHEHKCDLLSSDFKIMENKELGEINEMPEDWIYMLCFYKDQDGIMMKIN